MWAGGGRRHGVPTVSMNFLTLFAVAQLWTDNKVVQKVSINQKVIAPKTVGISTPGLNLKHLLEPNILTN